MQRLEDYVSEDGIYAIPVTYTMCSNALVSGVNNLKEALDVVKNYSDDIPINPTAAIYLEGSYKCEIDPNILLDSQTPYFKSHGDRFINPKQRK